MGRDDNRTFEPPPGPSGSSNAHRPRSGSGRRSTRSVNKKEMNSTQDSTGKRIPITDYTYDYWSARSSLRQPKKLTPSQLRKSVERLSTPYYMRKIRPHSAPPRPLEDATNSIPVDGASPPVTTKPGRPSSAVPAGYTIKGSNDIPATGTYNLTNLEAAWGPTTKQVKKHTYTSEAEMVERLYKVKDLPEIPEKQCMKLSYKFDPGARGGAGGYNEIWVPVKRYSEEEATSAILKMVSRHEEKAQKLHQKLQEKYMQPLVVSKQVNAADEEFLEKIELLYRGKGTVKRN